MQQSQITRRCHWVPQAYLRAFAADPHRKRVWRLSKESGGPELKRIDKVAVRHHLYVPKNEDGRRDDRLERKLAELEQFLASPIWARLQNEFVDLSSDAVRKLVALITATMFLRNPRQYDYTRYVHEKLVDQVSALKELPSGFVVNGKSYEVDPDSWPAYRDASDDEIKKMWLSQIEDATYFAKQLMTMRWSMLCCENAGFVTTDNPVVFLHPSLSFRGLKNPETSVVFPISPTRVINFDNLRNEPANQYYEARSPAAQNLLMWRYCIEHMFSPRDPHDVCAELLEAVEQHSLSTS